MVKWLRVLVFELGKEPKICELPDNRKALELTICGPLEITKSNRPGCIIIYNGNNVLAKTPNTREEINGTFIIAGADHSDLASLNDEDIEILKRLYK